MPSALVLRKRLSAASLIITLGKFRVDVGAIEAEAKVEVAEENVVAVLFLEYAEVVFWNRVILVKVAVEITGDAVVPSTAAEVVVPLVNK